MTRRAYVSYCTTKYYTTWKLETPLARRNIEFVFTLGHETAVYTYLNVPSFP